MARGLKGSFVRAERMRLRSHKDVGLHTGRKILNKSFRKCTVVGCANMERPSTGRERH